MTTERALKRARKQIECGGIKIRGCDPHGSRILPPERSAGSTGALMVRSLAP